MIFQGWRAIRGAAICSGCAAGDKTKSVSHHFYPESTLIPQFGFQLNAYLQTGESPE